MLVLEACLWLAGGLAAARSAAGLALLLRHVRRSRLRPLGAGPTPPLSVLKPLYGDEPGLRENLEATLRQNYPDFEVLFLHERPDDPAVAVARAAAAAVPDVPVRFLAGRAEGPANPKSAVLVNGEAAAAHDRLVLADSDVRPDPLYLRDVARALDGADLCSFVPVFFGAATPGARCAALGLNTDGVAGFLLLDGRASAGATIGVTKEALGKIGGLSAVGDFLAEDDALGRAVHESGGRCVLARRAARVYGPRYAYGHLIRWARTVRAARPAGYAFGVVAAAGPAALLALAVLGSAAAGWTLAAQTLARACMAAVADLRFARDGSLLRGLPLLPLLWFLEPVAWVLGCFGRHVEWRGRRYRLHGRRASLDAR